MAISDEALAQLREMFSGSVLVSGDPGYDEARRVHNGMIDRKPAVIARCHVTQDVVDAVNFGRDQGLEISVRGGGHNVAGLAVTEGGLMIDLAPMKGVFVDPASGTAWAQPGVTWGEYNRATAVYGQATTGGVISSTGVAGLTLGGGLGWLMGKHGMAVDNLLAAEVVLASGEVVQAGEGGDADLLWALTGGGGNFGVVTGFKLRTHPLATVIGGMVAHPLPAAKQVLGFYRERTATLPDELTMFCGFVHAPDGSGAKLCALAVCHCGDDADQAEADVKDIREFGPPVVDMMVRMPYAVANTGMDAAFPRGALNYWKSGYLTELSDDAIQIIEEQFAAAPTPMCAMVVEHFHGACTRVEPTATAFPHREEGYNVVIAGQGEDQAQIDAATAWVRQTFERLQPHMADRFYVNYLGADERDRVRQAYGPCYDRLLELKRRYDPNNLFRLNQNVQ